MTWPGVVGALAAAALSLAMLGCAPTSTPGDRAQAFDLQAHRGGLGLRPESSAAAFENALRLGVSTLELDVQITEDGQAVITHDRRTNPVVCTDSRPVTPDDAEFPYVGKLVKDLTVAQLRTLDCGTRRPADPTTDRFAGTQLPAPGARMLLLRELFELVREHGAAGADGVWLNVETKVEAGAPEETAPRETFVDVVVREVRAADAVPNVTIQSFDWGALMLVRAVEPGLPIVALTNGTFLQVGWPGASPWLGGIDIDTFGGDLVAAARSFGADAISPVHGDPQNGSIGDPGYRPFVTATMVRDAHDAGMRVIPWTVDDACTMTALLDLGVDGLITNYPDRLRAVLAARGTALPRAYPPN